jgi:hypothetical protein
MMKNVECIMVYDFSFGTARVDYDELKGPRLVRYQPSFGEVGERGKSQTESKCEEKSTIVVSTVHSPNEENPQLGRKD